MNIFKSPLNNIYLNKSSYWTHDNKNITESYNKYDIQNQEIQKKIDDINMYYKYVNDVNLEQIKEINKLQYNLRTVNQTLNDLQYNLRTVNQTLNDLFYLIYLKK
jgi:chromosome segregation ATPase